jgi:tetratricopeptide (TPR) repeat protein
MNPTMRKLAAAFLFVGLVCVTNASAQEADAIAKANQEYNAGHFREAVELYQTAVGAGATNAALFYNLGNAWYRAGDFGQAILNYERALALKPQHPEAAANLHLVRDKARALELRAAWWEEFTERATPNQYSIAAATSIWVAAFCFAAWFMGRRRSTGLFLTSLLGLVVFAISSTALYALATGRHGPALAIVTGEKIEARVATADNAGSVLVLPPGSEIKILSTRGDWIYAALPNDLRGWIPSGSAERVRW